MRALAEIPLSSLAHLVAPSDSLTVLTRALLLGVGDVLHVDDLDQCDPLSLALLHRLSREPGRTIVATVRTENGRLPDVVADFANDPATRIVDVPPFTRDEARDLLATVLAVPSTRPSTTRSGSAPAATPSTRSSSPVRPG